MRWLLGALLLLAAALLLQLDLLAYAMYALLCVMALSRWAAQNWVRNIAADRECNRLSAEIGETVAVVVTARNRSRLPIPWVLFEDLAPPDALIHDPPNLRVSGRRILLTSFRGGGRKLLLYQVTCNRRGYYQLGPLVMETGDLFGLHRRYRVATKPHFLLVFPRVIPLEGYDVASRRPIGEVRMSHRLYQDPTRIAGVRPYRAGDPLNQVHWRATARTGRLHSKVYEPSTVAGATILLDFHKASHEASNEPYRSELAVTAAASVANAVYEMGQQVGLVTNGRDAADRIRQEGWAGDIRSRREARQSAGMRARSDRLRPVIVETRRGPEQFARILETLARVELTDGLTLPQLITEAAGRIPRDATVIALLPRATLETAVALGRLRRRGFAITAVLNLFDEFEFGRAAELLQAEGIAARQLKDERAVAAFCREFVLR